MNFKDVAKVEANGKIKAVARSNDASDGFVVAINFGGTFFDYHVHPTASPEYWGPFQAALAANEIELVAAAVPDGVSVNTLFKQAEHAIQLALDAGAAAWGYDNLMSAASYASSTIEKFKHESAALVRWRDEVWIWAAQVMANIENGLVAAPESIEQFLQEMPDQPARP